MAEWSKAPVLKTGEVHASVGSNPTPSASNSHHRRRTAMVGIALMGRNTAEVPFRSPPATALDQL